MNERIAKLANESGFDVDKTGTFGDYSVMHRVEKFAELIVRECAEVSKNYAGGSMPLSIALAIKKHFGVEPSKI
jgi:hypothetical protein